MRILAIDTALGACSACIVEAGSEDPLSAETLAMERGHAEALLPLIERVVSRVDGGFESLDRVAVTVGPGSFTGSRVGIAAARAIGLASRVPVLGVSTLSALLAPLVTSGARGLLAAAIDARHGHVFFQAVAPGGGAIVAPAHLSLRDAVRQIGAGPVTIAGSGSGLVAAEAAALGVEVIVHDVAPAPDIVWVARLGLVASPEEALARPLYLRSPDAKPQDHMRLARR